MEHKKKKSRAEEGVNADDSEDEEETIDDVSITMYTDGPVIEPYTKVIPPDTVITYKSDGDSNSESISNSNYETEDEDDGVSGEK